LGGLGRAGKGQNEAVDAAIVRRLDPYATGDKYAEHSANAPQGASLFAVSGEVNRMYGGDQRRSKMVMGQGGY